MPLLIMFVYLSGYFLFLQFDMWEFLYKMQKCLTVNYVNRNTVNILASNMDCRDYIDPHNVFLTKQLFGIF